VRQRARRREAGYRQTGRVFEGNLCQVSAGPRARKHTLLGQEVMRRGRPWSSATAGPGSAGRLEIKCSRKCPSLPSPVKADLLSASVRRYGRR
jgi:hypothetical protein